MRTNTVLRYILPIACVIAMQPTLAAGEKRVIWPLPSNQAPASDSDGGQADQDKKVDGTIPMDGLTPPGNAIWPVDYGSSGHYAASMQEGTADLVVPVYDPKVDTVTPRPFDGPDEGAASEKQKDVNGKRTGRSKKSKAIDKKESDASDKAVAEKPRRRGLWFRRKPVDDESRDRDDTRPDTLDAEKTADATDAALPRDLHDYPAPAPSPAADMQAKPVQFVPYEDYLDSYRAPASKVEKPDDDSSKREKRTRRPDPDAKREDGKRDVATGDVNRGSEKKENLSRDPKARENDEITPAVPPAPPQSRLEEVPEAWRQAHHMAPPTPAEVETYRQRLELRLLERYNNLPDHAGQVAKVSVVLSKPLQPSLDGSRIRAEFDQLVYDPWGKRIPVLEQEYYVVVFGSGGTQQVRSDPSIRVGLNMEKTYSEHTPLAADPFKNVPEDAAFQPAPKAKMPDWWRPEFRDDY